LDKIKSLIDAYEKVNLSDKEKVNFILAERNIPEELFPQVEALVKKNGLLLESLKIEPEEDAKKSSGISLTKKVEDKASLPKEIGRVKASLNVIGVDYFSLKSLISAMENNLIVTDIISVNFSPEGGSAELVFYSYYLKK
jgi:polyribonucleotide nucleotidyltransferase